MHSDSTPSLVCAVTALTMVLIGVTSPCKAWITLTTSLSAASSSPPAEPDAPQGCGPGRDTPPAGDDSAATAAAARTPAEQRASLVPRATAHFPSRTSATTQYTLSVTVFCVACGSVCPLDNVLHSFRTYGRRENVALNSTSLSSPSLDIARVL